MTNKFLAIMFLLTSFGINASPNVGITTLLYVNDINATNTRATNKQVESGISWQLQKFNKSVLANVQGQLLNFQPKLQHELAESGDFIVFDAKPIIKSWQVKNPQILSILENQSTTALTESETTALNAKKIDKNKSQESNVTTVKLPNSIKYVLIGWVEQVSVNEERQAIMNSGKISILYNLDIKINYKLIDSNNLTTVAEFIALGHGGVARIVMNNAANILFDNNSLVNDAMDSLLTSIKHGLLVKQMQGIIPGKKIIDVAKTTIVKESGLTLESNTTKASTLKSF